MESSEKKLHLISELLKVEDESILNQVATIIAQRKQDTQKSGSLRELSGIWTEAEAQEMKQVIATSCEQINPDDWK